MKPIRVAQLQPGMRLSHPLYNESQVLLLAPGQTLTREMLLGLRRSGAENAYLGTVNYLTSGGVSEAFLRNHRAKAEAASREIEAEFDRLLSKHILDPLPSGPPLAERMKRDVHEPRSLAEMAKARKMAEEADRLVADLTEGRLALDAVADAVRATAGRFTQAMLTDAGFFAMLAQTRRHDTYLYSHAVNVSLLAIQIATATGHDQQHVEQVGLSALVQDIGMSLVPREVTEKPGRLDAVERIDVQKHTFQSCYLMDRFRGLPLVPRFVAMQCHERCDGGGYPRRRKKELIHRFARIVAVADIYDALIAPRPWRAPHHPYDAMKHLLGEVNAGKLDADAVRGLIRVFSLFPIGTYVRLSSGETARVVQANRDAATKPIVAIVRESSGASPSEPVYVNLARDDGREITDVVRDEEPELPPLLGF